MDTVTPLPRWVDEAEEIHCIPEQPVFVAEELMEILRTDKSGLWRIRKKGFLKNLPGYSRKIAVARAQLVFFLMHQQHADAGRN